MLQSVVIDPSVRDQRIRGLIEAKVKECLAKYRAYANHEYPTQITVDLNCRGLVAGWARGTCRVSLNESFLRAYEQDMIDQTLPHEVAHLFDKHLNGANSPHRWRSLGHGASWKKIMASMLDLNPDRCHKYDVGVIYPDSHKMVCGKCGHVQRITNRNWSMRRYHWENGLYSHTGCGGRFLPEGMKLTQEQVAAQKPESGLTSFEGVLKVGGYNVLMNELVRSEWLSRHPYVYRCSLCKKAFHFSKRRHNNVLRGTQYACQCGGSLVRMV